MSSESKLLGALCHGSIFVGMPIVIPLLIYLLKKDDDFVNHHARESLTMHIIGVCLSIAVGILCIVLIGFLFLIPLAVLALVYTIFGIVGIIKSLYGEYYYYPVTTRFAEAWFND